MAALVRVKRHLDEEPSEAIVISRKRRKICKEDIRDDLEKTEFSTVLKFAGTIKKDENVFTHLKNQRVSDIRDLKELFKNRSINVGEKLRTEKQESSKNNRYKIVNCFRSINLENNVSEENKEAEASEEYTIYDIETDVNDNSKIENKNNEDVYDLYYTNSDDFGDTEIEEYVSIFPLNDPLLMGSFRENGLNDIESDCDSEDSNAENNWRNDYPDEDEMQLNEDEDMLDGMNNFTMDEDLSTDDEYDNICGSYYNEFPDRCEIEDDVDSSDEYQYGEGYARFKAKNQNVQSSGLNEGLYYGDIDENEYYY